MAIECDVASLAEAAKCFNSGYDALVLRAMRIVLLCGAINGDTMDCSPDALAELIPCFLNQEAGTLDAIETYLVCQLANGGGGGGGGSPISSGVVDPVAAPTNPAVDNVYFNIVNLAAITMWLWPAGGAAWSQVV
jgi:hypothetical protein